MSTKFSGIPKVQKPPAVCRKPPYPEMVPPPPFNERWYQGYVEWYDPEGSDDIPHGYGYAVKPTPAGRTPFGLDTALPCEKKDAVLRIIS